MTNKQQQLYRLYEVYQRLTKFISFLSNQQLHKLKAMIDKELEAR
jgi:hypothetical protein